MRKILTTLGCALLLGASSFTASATDYTVSAINPTYATASQWSSSNDFWNLSSITITLSPSINKAYIDVNSAQATIKYDGVDGNYSGTLKFTTGNNTISVAPTDLSSLIDFLANGPSQGATGWIVTIFGVSLNNGEDDITTATAEGASVSMSNFITITYNYPSGSTGGGSDSSINWDNQIQWDVEFTADKTKGFVVPSNYYGAAYITSNSQTNYFQKGQIGVYLDKVTSGSNMIDSAKWEDIGDENVYYVIETLSTMAGDEYFYYGGDGEVKFTFHQGEYSANAGGGDDSEYTLNWNEAKEISESPTKWPINRDGYTGDFYIKTSSNTDWVTNDYLELYTDLGMGMDFPQTLSPVLVDGVYYYTGTLNTYDYWLQFSGIGGLEVTLVQGELNTGGSTEPEPTPSANVIEAIGTTYTAAAGESVWTYTDANEEASFLAHLLTNSSVNLFAEGKLTVSTDGYVFDEYDFEAVLVDNVYAYNFAINGGIDYVFTFDVDSDVEFSIEQDWVGGAQALAYAYLLEDTISLDDPYGAFELSWGETVTITAGSEIEIPVNLLVEGAEPKFKGNLSLANLQLQPSSAGEPGIMTLAEFGDQGDILFILATTSELFDEVGEYQIVLPAGLVVNLDGSENEEQYINVYVTSLVEPIDITPAQNSDFAIGDEVEFTLLYNSDLEAIENATVANVYNSNTDENSYEASFTWKDINTVSIDGSALVINLGSELPMGYYSLTIYENVVTVDEVANAMVEIMFTVGNPSGVNSIGAALEGNEAIYNLQGVRVDANKLNKGIYIINGKKVLVK